MTNEQREQMDELENVLIDLQRSFAVWEAARVMELDEEDKERANVLYDIFGERIEGEIQRLGEVYDALHDLLVADGKVGF